MSDEAERVRATLRVLDVLEFNGVPAAVVTADAVKALASLESQNQALQERIEKLEKGLRNITSGIDHHPTRSNDAHDADHLYSFIQSALGIVDQRAKQLLSPHPGD
jgi:hypothetical protein